jgi:hypothetical protein
MTNINEVVARITRSRCQPDSRDIDALLAHLATVEAERDRYKAALRQIADTDYRGNRSHESIIAYRALEDRL